jgi:hypothetical protein
MTRKEKGMAMVSPDQIIGVTHDGFDVTARLVGTDIAETVEDDGTGSGESRAIGRLWLYHAQDIINKVLELGGKEIGRLVPGS